MVYIPGIYPKSFFLRDLDGKADNIHLMECKNIALSKVNIKPAFSTFMHHRGGQASRQS